MDCFKVNILGCGSAKPTLRHSPTAQIVNFRGNLFLVDCGEGVQIGLARNHIPVGKIGHILLSHLHGDHCLGLVHAHKDAERIFQPLFDFFCPNLSMKVTFQSFDTRKSEVIYEDDSLLIKTIPLSHRVPTAGFLFQEKPRDRHLLVEKCEALGIPFAYFRGIKKGMDWTNPETGEVIPCEMLTTDPTPSKSYVFCSDTMYSESIIPIIRGCDVLYHESTYSNIDTLKAHQRGHSTSVEAATIALKAEVGRLLLGHYSSQFQTYEDEKILLDEAQQIFPNTELTREQMVIDI